MFHSECYTEVSLYSVVVCILRRLSPNQSILKYVVSSKTSTEVNTPREKVRPVRIVARRGRELMCVLEMQESEWQDIDDVDSTDIDIPVEILPASGTPIIDIVNVVPIWNDDDENY